MENLSLWDKLKTAPKEAQKPINGGRLKGMTDISPQWRYYAMTEQFGPVGIGWKYTIDRQWVEQGSGVEQCAMCNISLFYKHGGEWSEAIPGTGGSSFVTQESKGPYTSDEAFKMALTDALSVAMKALGVAATIYSGGNDYSKYTSPQNPKQNATEKPPTEDIARVKESLRRLFGDDKKSALDKVEELTEFKGRDGKMVPGVRDYTTISSKRLEILADKLEKLAADKRAETPELCSGCMNPLVDGKCQNPDCIPF